MARRYRKKRRISKRRYRRGGRKSFRRYRRKYRSGKSLRRIKIGSVKGYGGYKINSNSILSGGMSPPKIMNTFTNDGVVLRHREFVGNLTLSSADPGPDNARPFKIEKVCYLNPGVTGDPKGNVIGLPWLSGICENWKEYEWHGVLLEYKPLTALATTTGAGAMGSVVIGTHYDTFEAPYKNKIEMLNAEYTTSGKPQLTQIHPIECKRSQTVVSRKWVRTGAIPEGADRRLYDHCRIEIATEGIPGPKGSVLGELWITFEVCLFKPKLVDKVQFSIDAGIDTYRASGAVTVTTAQPVWKYVLSPNTTLAPIKEESNMFGALIPSNTAVSGSRGTYFWNKDVVQRGDVFRILTYTGTSGGITHTLSGLNIEKHGCDGIKWFRGVYTGQLGLLAPEAGTASGQNMSEYYIILTDWPADSQPYVIFEQDITLSAIGNVDYYMLVHRIMNMSEVLEGPPDYTILEGGDAGFP